MKDVCIYQPNCKFYDILAYACNNAGLSRDCCACKRSLDKDLESSPFNRNSHQQRKIPGNNGVEIRESQEYRLKDGCGLTNGNKTVGDTQTDESERDTWGKDFPEGMGDRP